MRRYAALAVWFLFVLGLLAIPGVAQQPQANLGPKNLENFRVRSVGPANMSGRIVELAVVESDTKIQYVATASGGLWKTTDDGKTWNPIFDGQPTQNLGAVAVSQTNPSIVWVGTGESNPRNSVAWGDGVYKSTDGGKSWKNMGLKDTQHIGRVVIHPKNPDVVYVAALGHIWGPNKERGIFKTTDAGKTWNHVLALDENTGCIDLVIDPAEPDTLYAAAYCVRRDAFSGGNPATQIGPKAGLYKTTDGGRAWDKMAEGLPKVGYGRSGLAVYRKDPNIVYAVVQSSRTPDSTAGQGPNLKNRGGKGKKGGGDDDIDGDMVPFFVEQKDDPKKVGEQKKDVEQKKDDSKKAGEQKKDVEQKKDDPKKAGEQKKDVEQKKDDPKQPAANPITADDGGVFRSEDRGKTWTQMNSLVPRPFYYGQIRIDPNNDQRIYVLGTTSYASSDGGKLFSATAKGGVHSDHHALWINPADSNHLILGSDGGLYYSRDKSASYTAQRGFAIGQFYAVAVDMRQQYRVYGGLQDNGSWGGPTATTRGDGITIQDWYNVGGGDGFYVAVDPTDANIVYSESQYGNPRRGDLSKKGGGKKGGGGGASIKPGGKGGGFRYNWSSPFFISPHDSKTLYYGANVLFKSENRGDAWKAISPDLTRAAMTPNGHTLSTLGESAKQAGVLWTGSDDGRIHVSRDGGGKWDDVSDKIPGPKARWITRVEPSAHAEGTCYVSYSRYRNDDRKPYLFKTTNFGETWQTLMNNLPAESAVHVIKESSRNQDLLFVGMEHGLFVSFNRGLTWQRFGQGLPPVSVHDLVIHPRERDLVIGTHGRSIYVVDIGPLEEWNGKVAGAGEHLFAVRPALSFKMKDAGPETRNIRAPNPAYGATLWTYFKDAPAAASLSILDAEKKVIATVPVANKAGIQSIVWNLKKADGKEEVAPGEYTVQLRVGDRTLTRPLRVEALETKGVAEED